MAQNISVGIDIGTDQIKVIAVDGDTAGSQPSICGSGHAATDGLKRGYAVDLPEISGGLEKAITQASESIGEPIRSADLAITSESLGARRAAGSISFDTASHYITESDVEDAMDRAETQFKQGHQKNYNVLHRFPVAFKVDGRDTMGRPEGLEGKNLAVNTLFITALSQHVYDLVEAVEDIGVRVNDVVASPLAASKVALSGAQKRAGCILANVGAETVSTIVFEDKSPVSAAVFPIGSTSITNDIALGLKTSLENADKMKRGTITGSRVPQKKLDEIITARLEDVFELISNHLEKIGKTSLLPAGIILTGGGAALKNIEKTAKETLDIPAEKITIKLPNSKIIRELGNSAWTVAYGTAVNASRNNSTDVVASLRNTSSSLLSWAKQFLP